MGDSTIEIETEKWPIGSLNKSHVAILTVINLVIGIYLISSTVLISKDGTGFIECAKNLSNTVHNTGQAPGYPFLIYSAHKAIGTFYDSGSLQGWIVSAQAVSLLSKIVATIALCFVGSYFVGSRLSFWGVLILSVLPDSAEYGSDALTDWSNIMFLAIGFLLLLLGVQYRKIWIFGLAGVASGMGYLVRPECGQVVLYGCLWLVFNIFRPQGKMERTKTTGALILLLAGFSITAVPYMLFKGYVFPEHEILKLPVLFGMIGDIIQPFVNTGISYAGINIKNIIGSESLVNNVCETLVYYFFLPLLLGSYYYFHKYRKNISQIFFASAFIFMNIGIASWQLSYLGFLSRRHTLPLVVFTIFYIPIGFDAISNWVSSKTSRNTASVEKNIRHWFIIFMAIGLCICAVKLIRTTLRSDKQGYRISAEWLSKNTDPADTIAVPDKRIAFYAQRRWIEYYDATVPEHADYAVRELKDISQNPGTEKTWEKKFSWTIDRRSDKKMIVIFKKIK